MSQIHIVIGFKGPSLQSEVVPVYVGRSGVEAEAAIKARTDLAQCHWSRGLPRGVFKRNGNVIPQVEPSGADSGALARANFNLKCVVADLQIEIEDLRAALAKAAPVAEPSDSTLDPESSLLDPSSEDTEPILPITNASPGSLAPGKRRK